MIARWEAVWAIADGWERAALVALLIAAIAQTTFILIYGTRPWWRVRVGRALFLKSAALALLLDLSVVNNLFAYQGQEQVGAVVVMLIAATIVYQLVALVRSPRQYKENP